jgi:D-lyxose ketol-isomerase
MQELDKGLDISLKVDEKVQGKLAAFHQQMDAWGICLPPVEPLVLDFGLGKFDQVGLIEYWIANEVEAGYCGKYMFVFDGQQCPPHFHRVKHETFFVLQGQLIVKVDGRTFLLRPGQALPIRPGLVHSFQGQGNTLMLELSMPCKVSDNQFEDPRIAAWLRRFIPDHDGR